MFGSVYASRPSSSSVGPISSYDSFMGLVPYVMLLYVWAAWKAQRSVRGVQRLRDFTLDAAECSSAADKAAILKTIGEWYADTQAGEDDPDAQRRFGEKQFEALVRHELLPLLERHANVFDAGVFVRLSLVTWLPRLLDFVASPTVSLPHALQQCITYLWFAVTTFAIFPLAARLGVRVTLAMSALLRRLLGARFGKSFSETLRYFCLAPIGVLVVTPCVRAVWELLYLLVFPNRLDKSRLGLDRIETLHALQKQFYHVKGKQRAGYVAPTDDLDAAHRALYKQQAVALLLLILATLALTMPKADTRRG